MTSASNFLRPRVTALLLTAVFLAQVSQADPPPPTAVASKPEPPPPASGVIGKTYLALVRDSLVPANPRTVAAAALASLPAERVLPLPAGFGEDGVRDAAWLDERAMDLPPQWSVLEAMVRATNTPHTALITPKRIAGMRALGAGRPLSAPGFQLFPLADGSFVVGDLIAGASADRAGLKTGDIVRRIAGRPTLRMDMFWLATQPAGTTVSLEIERDAQVDTRTLELQPAEVSPVESRWLDGKIAYVRIRWFARSKEADHDTASLVRQALADFVTGDARGLVLDLRSSLGGSGEVSIASALCDGAIIYSIRQPLAAPAKPYPREGARIWPDRPVVVLVNELTVSAPEDLALVLRELGHFPIIGRTTGGGLTEFSPRPLGDGYLLIYPTGMVFGPVTDALQPGFAVKPDVEVSNPDLTEMLNGKDRQLEAARAAIAGK